MKKGFDQMDMNDQNKIFRLLHDLIYNHEVSGFRVDVERESFDVTTRADPMRRIVASPVRKVAIHFDIGDRTEMKLEVTDEDIVQEINTIRKPSDDELKEPEYEPFDW
jgi:hypothetical protein